MRPRRAAVRRAASAKAVARVQNRLLSRQAAVQSRLTRTLRQEQVEYGYSYTALFNGFSVRTARKNLEAIRNTKGVTCAFVAGSYALPTTQQADTQALQVALASSRFTGKGMTIAVLDTGLDTAHPAFANAPADAKFTKDYISGVLQAADLNAEVLMPGVTADDVYLSAKIPFAFDYAGKDAQVAPGSKWDAENLEHGTHVAGIAAGYAVDGEGAVTFSGVAPDAQVIPMKVFDDSGTGAATTTILAALEDAYRLGVDAANLSLGSYGGFTVDDDALINDVYNKLDDAGIMVITAAGNETSSSYMNSYGTDAPLTGDPDNSVVAVTAEYQGMTASFTVHVGPYPGSVELYHTWIQARSNRIFLQGKQGIVGAGRDGIHATDTAATSDDQIITFTNSDPNVVDLTNPVIRATSNRDLADECAFVDARNPGNAVITAAVGEESVSCTVTVKSEDDTSGDNSTTTKPNDTTKPGDTTTTKPSTGSVDVSKLTLESEYGTTIKPNDGTFDISLPAGLSCSFTVKGTDMTAAWSSADSSIATVSSDGTVKTVSRGETTLTIKLGSTEVKCLLRVTK